MRISTLFRFREYLDDAFFELLNLIYSVFFLGCLTRNHTFVTSLEQWRHISFEDDPDVFICATGPSVTEVQLQQLIGKKIIAVNRFFEHERYQELAPVFHVFMDSKLVRGTWDLNWLLTIKSKSPETIIVLNAAWFYNSKLKEFINSHSLNVRWIYTNSFPTCFRKNAKIKSALKLVLSLGVVGAAVSIAALSGAKNIYMLGKDSTGLLHELMNSNSHFYGVNPDNTSKSNLDLYRDIYFMYSSLKMWENFVHILNRHSIRIFNVCNNSPLRAVPMIRTDMFNKMLEHSEK